MIWSCKTDGKIKNPQEGFVSENKENHTISNTLNKMERLSNNTHEKEEELVEFFWTDKDQWRRTFISRQTHDI